MSYNKENKPDTFASQENDPAMANIDLSRLDSSGFIKVLGNSTKGPRSRTSSRSSSMRGNSPPPKKDPLVHKSVIQQKAHIPPPKDWDEPAVPAEIKDLTTSDMPINEESVVKYESQFPALGESTETLAKSEMVEFTPEILNPQTIVQTSILKEATDTSSAAANPEDLGVQESKSILMDQSQEKHEHLNEFADGWAKEGELPVPEHVDIQVPEEKAEVYTSHFPALGAEPEEVHPETEFTPEILAPETIETPQVEELQIPIENIPVETMKESPADRTPENSETDEVQQIEAFMKLPLEEIPSGVAHGFASGRSPSHKDLAKKGIPDEVPATFSGTLEALEPGFVETNVLRDIGNSANIPLDEIPGGIAKGFASGRSPSHKDLAAKNIADEVPATFSGVIESLGPQVMGANIPLNEIVGGMAKGFGNGRSPSHKELAANNIPDEVPATFSGTVEELEYEYMFSSLPLDNIPSDIAMGLQDTPDPTHFQLVRMGLFDDVPATFSEAFEAFTKSEGGQTILEQKLESELEQEDQALDNLLGGVQQKFIGKYQRIKQDRELEKTDDNLLKSWEVIKTDLRTNKGEDILDHSGYKPARVGEQEEAEGLLDEEEKVVAEEEAFGTYKSAVKKNNVEIKDETPLQPVEENIVIPPENQNEGINMQDLIKPELKEIEKTEFSDREKPSGEKSSLEHIAESSELGNRSTEMTLSSQRIDLIKEELKEVIDQSSRDPIFHEIEKNLYRAKELEKSRMYGAAINLLKKNLEILDARIARHDMTFDVREMNSLLINCNAELAQCYHQVIDYRLSMQYARAALNLDSKNTQAIYYLGAAQNKTGDFLGGYNTLKEIKRLGLPAGHDDYLILIESEILKFEKKVEDGAKKAEMGMITPVFKDLPKTTRTPMEDKQDSASLALSNIGVFVGTSSLAGAASWMLSKNHFKLSEKKTFMYSVGIGALIGTASLALLGHFRKAGNNKK